MRYVPHDYQTYVTEFIKSHPVAAVFLSMGLGKTVITLTALMDLIYDSFEVRKVLVIAPLRVARDTWADEIRKWDHLAGMRYSVAVGSAARRIEALRADADLYIINRENVEWLVERSGLEFDFDMVVIDELSSFKSWQARRFRSLMKVRPRVKRIVGLTGTPASNGLMDLWAEFRVLDMGARLGRFITRYRTDFFEPDKRNAQVVFTYKPKADAEEKIYSLIGDITISLKSDGLIRMPELVVSDHRVKLDEKGRRAYEELRKELVLELGDARITALNAASLSGKLMQAANGFLYTEGDATVSLHDAKLDALEDLVEASIGNSLLIAYWFKEDRKRIAALLECIGIQYVQMDSSEHISAWKEKRVQVGLIHPASAGHGLNIQSGGSTLIWYSVPWSLELYAQTVARLWRQGQKDESVVIIRLVAEGTIDERVVAALSRKKDTEDALLEAVKAEITKGGANG